MSQPQDRQDHLLQQEDGRYFAIDKVGTGIGSVATTEKLAIAFVHFGLPSGPALYLHLAHKAFADLRHIDSRSLFDNHEQGLWPDSQSPLFDFFEISIAHVVFSFTAIEAFVNETIPEHFVYHRKGESDAEDLHKPEIERYVTLDEKLHVVLPSALSVVSPKGSKIWQNYVALRKTRDRLIHLKSIDRKASGPEEKTIWGIFLNSPHEPWCDHAHALMGHFGPGTKSRRWYRLYPYDNPVVPT